MPIELDVPAAYEGFDEAGYLQCNEDVARNVLGSDADQWASGLQHFERVGHKEGRKMRQVSKIEAARVPKMARMESHFTRPPRRRIGAKFDFLSDAWPRTLTSSHPVSSNEYDEHVQSLIKENNGGLMLDCGAGQRSVYYENVVNYEIADYVTTDVLGVGESLPFKDDTFDGVISIAVLEHVRDPFRCAAELRRVLKPGGKVVCCVPFLQPYHGYPDHYFNMTGQGLRSLFEEACDIEFHEVIDSILPVWGLTWIVQSWADGLKGEARQEFLDQPVRSLLENPERLLNRTWVRGLGREKNFELASCTMLIGRKR